MARTKRSSPSGGQTRSQPKRRTSPPASKKTQIVKHKKKNTSAFGPILVQPKGNKWSLTASMGGSGVDGKKRAKKAGKNGRSNKWVAGNKQQTRKKWTLQMPVVSSTAPAAPWLSQRENSPGSEEGNKVRKILPALALPEASLRNLDKELLDFCTYVRLSESEIACRLEVVKQVQLQCGHLFGVSSDSIKVFGSFACLSVCTFASDIDLAIHDVVKVEQPSSTPAPQKDDGTASRRATKRQRSSRTETETTVAAAAAAVTDPNQKKQQRVLLWKAILEEAEDRKQQNKNDEDVPKTTSTTGVDASLASTPQKSNCATMIGKSTASGRRVEITHVQALPMSAEQNEDGMPLFVIDREGSTDEGDPKSNEDDQGLDAAIDASVPGEEKKEEDTAGPEACEVVSQKVGESAKQMDESTDDKDDLFGGDEDDSGGDSADILATLKTRGARPSLHEAVEGMSIRAEFNPEKKEVIEIDDDSDEADEPLKTETRPRSRSLISLCSATTCSDTEDREWDDSGMEVSFVSNGKPKAQLPEFTEEERVKVVRALNALGKRLRGALPLNFMHVRKRARVPIINMETRYGFECDIAVGGHQGMDTSGYAIAQCQRFHSFAPVVLLLKLLMNKHGLDKPFSGGIGSFKLYVMVTHHIEQHLEVGGQDNAAEVLITFLFRYGHIPDTTRGKLDDRIRTNLTQATIIQTHGQGAAKGTADMTSVFQLESCIRVFQASYFILRRKLQKPNSDPSHSLLGYLVDSQWLRGERAEFHRKIPQQKSTHQRFSGGSSPIPARLPSNWRSNERPRNTLESAAGRKSWDNTQKKPQSPEKPTVSLDTDEEAEQLIASYGIKTDKQKQDIHDGSPSSPGKSKKGRNRKSNA